MIDPVAARYEKLPNMDTLKSMTPDEIGRSLLPTIVDVTDIMSPQGIVARDFARVAGNFRSPTIGEYSELIMEGIAFLQRAGILIENPRQQAAIFLKLSRAGREAAKSEHPLLAAAGGQEARTLLHERIAVAALGHFERGGRFLDDAAFAAFREIEITVREMSGLGANHAKNLFYDAFAFEKNRKLIPSDMESGEAKSLREAVAGAYGYYRNPPAHGRVHDDPAQTMRILILASTLLYTIESLTDATSEGKP